ncbi:replication-relaxation family protein [Nonomuraea sp. NPDC050556]|uniref:replication-relaxation family protein n=1 Tax=Nonomuraea sp. NPDC050556 TaxID=3364369 RepID=UPI003789DDF1
MNQHYTPRVLASLATQLTERDRRLLRLVWTYKALTSQHLTQLLFDNPITARHRLAKLHKLGVVDRFRPKPPVGSAPWHYVLGEAGAAVLAQESGADPAEFGYRRDRALAIAYSQRLAHTIGVNGAFASLSSLARRQPDCSLITWWTEDRCKATWGKYVRPDAYGRWACDGVTLDFFLEYDNGTETFDRVVNKLGGYASLARSSEINTPVLFLTPDERREKSLHTRLRFRAIYPLIPVATAVDTGSPAEAVWLPTNRAEGRLSLADLATHWPNLGHSPAKEEDA